MTTVYDFIQNMSGVTDPEILSVVSAVTVFAMCMVTISFAVGILTYIFKPRI